MKPRGIPASTIALLVSGLLILATGTYTENGGFQLAGAIVLAVGVLLALRQATGRRDGGGR